MYVHGNRFEISKMILKDLVSFDEAISAADFISLHLPLTPNTDKVFNDDSFRKMKKGVHIINVTRGGVIDEEALVRALDSGIVAQVCIFFIFAASLIKPKTGFLQALH